MEIKWYGTASLLVEAEGDQILIDPFLTLRGAENHPSLSDFKQTDSILITHGHVDHLGSISRILDHMDATVYCGRRAAQTLERQNADGDQIVVVRPGDVLIFGKIKVTVLKGKHIRFDAGIIGKTFLHPRILLYFPNFIKLTWKNIFYREAGETYIYQIDAGGKRVLVLGSLGIDENTEYPEYVDMLVLPYQGASDLVAPALAIIEKIKPRTVLLDHFDDAFPPVSRQIDTRPLKKALTEKFPELPVVKPTAGKTITLL